MNEHPSFLVYRHLGLFLESRGLTPAAPEALGAKRERFITELNLIGYFRIDSRDSAGRVTVVLVLALRGKYTEHGPQLRTLLASLDSESFARQGRLAEVIVVAPGEVHRKKNIADIISEFRSGTAEGAARSRATAAAYNIYPYHIFSLEIPRVQSIPRHEIVPPADVAAFLARDRLGLSDLRTVCESSPPVVWIGGRAGQVVLVTSPSETAGVAHEYCLVTKN